MDDSYSGFLSLPTELRCHIYDYLLADSHAVTISAGYTTVFGNRIQDRARTIDIPGLPLDFAPLVRCHRDTSLLSVANAPTIPFDDGRLSNAETVQSIYPAPLALLQTCHLVNDELTDYKRGKKRMARAPSEDGTENFPDGAEDKQGLSLYVTYPYGVLVLKSMYPYLLKQARRVYISGHYASSKDIEAETPQSFNEGDERRLSPSGSFAVAESFGTPDSARPLGRRSRSGSHYTQTTADGASATALTARPRLRLDPPLVRQQRHASRTESLFPAFSPATCELAPLALALLVRTLLPPDPTQLVKLSARILYPGENSYASVWSDNNSPVTHILRNVCGGKIDMQVKRGSLGTGLCLTARPKPESRIVSTSWENWRTGGVNGTVVPARPAARRPTGRMEIADLDGFLMDI